MEKVLKISKEDENKIIKLLNKIKILEFKYNSILNEYNRISNYSKIREDEKFIKYKQEIEQILKPYIAEYKINISEIGFLDILKEIKETKITTIYQNILRLSYNIALPYNWVMGKPLGKRMSKQILDQYNYLLE